ncbi:MAG: hypothetical protein V4558_05035 [Gemmatimonadota bacterium]
MTRQPTGQFLRLRNDFVVASLRQAQGRLLRMTALAWLAACGTAGEAEVALNVPKVDTLPGGIVHLVNTGPTAWRDTSGWRWVAGATINPDEGSPGELGDISTLTIGDDGTVFALQRKPTTIKVFGPDGAFLRDIGKEGDGPGELRDGYMGMRGDTILFQSPGATRLSYFLTSGTFVKSVPSPCCYFWPRLTADSAGRVWVPGSGKNDKAAWFRFKMDGTIADTFEMPAQDDFRKMKTWTVTLKRGSNSMSMVTGVPMQPSTSFEPRVDGMIVGGNSTAYRFALLRGAADTVRIFEASAPTVAMSAAWRDSIFNAATAHNDPDFQKSLRASAKKEDIPTIWPVWTHMSLDGAGRLWVALPGDGGEVSRLQVFDRDGKLLGDVPTPNRKMFKNAAWGRDWLAVADEDADGRPVIKTYHLQTTRKK